MPREITAHSNPLIKRARQLHDKRHRRDEGLFLAEGLRILVEAADAGRLPAWLFFTGEAEAHPLVRRLVDGVERAGGDAIRTSRDILHKLSGKDNPQTVLGAFPVPETGLAHLPRDRHDLWLVAQALRDPGNLGTILRTGDAVGAGGLILLDEAADPFSVEAVRASMGAVFTQGIARATWAEFVAWLRAAPGQLVGLALDGAVPFRGAPYATPTFLMVGNEAHGLPPAYTAACDLTVRIPMAGKADSLNAAVSLAVVAYEVAVPRPA